MDSRRELPRTLWVPSYETRVKVPASMDTNLDQDITILDEQAHQFGTPRGVRDTRSRIKDGLR